MSRYQYQYLKKITKESHVGIILNIVKDWETHLSDPLFAKLCLQACYQLILETKNIDHVLDAGAGRLCIKSMKVLWNETGVQWRGLRFMKHISKGAISLSRDGAADVVLAALKNYPREESLQNYGLSAVRALALTRPNAEYFISNDIATTIRRSMRTFASKVKVQKSALAAVNALVKTDEIKMILFQNRIVYYVVKAMNLYPDDKKVLYSGLIFLMEIGVEYAQIQIGADDCIMRTMKKHKQDARIIQNGCAAIKALSALEFNVGILLEKDVVKILLECLSYHQDNMKIQETACLAFWSLGLWEKKRRKLYDDGLGTYIFQVCSKYKDNGNVFGYALSVLNNLVTEEDIALEFINEGILRIIIQGAKGSINVEEVQNRFISTARTFAATTFALQALRNSSIVDVVQKSAAAHPSNSTIQKKSGEILEILRE